MISNVAKVYVTVGDQQAAPDFWTGPMGFLLVRDDSFGDERRFEVRPPEQDLLLVLTKRSAADSRREVPDRLPHSNIFFNCADIVATHCRADQRGVRFPLPPSKEHFGWWSLFEDNEGTRYALDQWAGDADR